MPNGTVPTVLINSPKTVFSENDRNPFEVSSFCKLVVDTNGIFKDLKSGVIDKETRLALVE